jgi:cystathionine beta-synthase
MVQIEDKETFVMTRELLTKEGLYCGVSSGGAVVGAIKWFKENAQAMKGKNILVILPDSGNRYLSKVYDDDWMREAGFLDTSSLGKVSDLVHSIKVKPEVVMAMTTDSLSKVIELMHDKGISQMPVKDTNGWIKGVINETQVLNSLYQNKAKATDKVEGSMDTGVEYVKLDDPIEKISAMISKGKTALVTEKGENSKVIGIITKIDLLTYLSQKMQSN